MLILIILLIRYLRLVSSCHLTVSPSKFQAITRKLPRILQYVSRLLNQKNKLLQQTEKLSNPNLQITRSTCVVKHSLFLPKKYVNLKNLSTHTTKIETGQASKPSFCFVNFYLLSFFCRLPKGGVFKGGGNWGNPKDSVWEDWGTLGKIREPPPLGTPPPLNNPIILQFHPKPFTITQNYRLLGWVFVTYIAGPHPPPGRWYISGQFRSI